MAKTIAVEATIPATITLEVREGNMPIEIAAAIIRQDLLTVDDISSLARHLETYVSQKRREEFGKKRYGIPYDEED